MKVFKSDCAMLFGASVHAIDVHEHDIVTKRIENYNACIIAWHRVYIGPKSVQRIHFMGEINIDFISRAKRGKNFFLISNLFFVKFRAI